MSSIYVTHTLLLQYQFNYLPSIHSGYFSNPTSHPDIHPSIQSIQFVSIEPSMILSDCSLRLPHCINTYYNASHHSDEQKHLNKEQ